MQTLLEEVGSPDALLTTAYVLLEGVLDALREQPGDTPRQQMPGTRLLAQTYMPAHGRYHRRMKPSASSRPT